MFVELPTQILIFVGQIIVFLGILSTFYYGRKQLTIAHGDVAARINEIHVTMNSRLDELLALTARVSRAEGKLEAEADARSKLKDLIA